MRLSPSLTFACTLGLLAACGGTPPAESTGKTRCQDLPLSVRGMTGAPVPAVVAGNVFAVAGAINGVDGGLLLVDTGAPITLIDPAFYPGAQVASGNGTVATLETLGLTLENAPVVGAELELSLPSGALGGILGGNVLCHFPASFNYRDAQVTLGPPQLPSALEERVVAPFALEGGGLGRLGDGKSLVQFTGTRISVAALVEGVERQFVVDTGASVSLVSPELYAQLISDGRGKLEGLQASTVMGSAQTRVTRVRTLSVGAAEVKGLAVADVSGQLLAGLGLEVGHQVDGLLGGSFLREFFVTVDYGAGELQLSRYSTRTHIQDEFRRVGVLLALSKPPSNSRYSIGSVLPGTDAAKQGLQVGETVLAVDGQSLNVVEPGEADLLLHGAVGASVRLQLAARTVSVKVDELLALP